MTMLTELTEMGKWEAIKTEYVVVTIFMGYADCWNRGVYTNFCGYSTQARGDLFYCWMFF